MPTLDIGGRPVPVGDEFLRLSPADQQKTVDEIATKLGIRNQADNPPPPGAIIHDVGRSYVVPPPTPVDPLVKYSEGQPRAYSTGLPSPSVKTTGLSADLMSPEFSGELGGDINAPNRATAAAALQVRRDTPAYLKAATPFYQGLSGNYGDELVSGLRALGATRPAEAYDIAQQAQRGNLADVRTAYPGGSAAAELLGNLAWGPALAARGPLAAGAAAARAPIANVAAGATGGGLLGAAMGFGEGETLKERGGNATTGGLLGAAAGVAAPLVSQLGQGGAQKVMDYRTVNRQLQDLGRRLGIGDLGRGAADLTGRSLAAEQASLLTGETLRGRINTAGPEGMLVDAGGEPRSLLDTIIQSGGEASGIARRATRERGLIASDVATQALDNALGGPPRGIAEMVENIRVGGRPFRHQAYEAADAVPIDYASEGGQNLQGMLSRVPDRVLRQANEMMQVGGYQSQQLALRTGEKGELILERLPDVRQLDFVTQALRHEAEHGQTAGKLGGATPYSSQFGQLATDLRRQMRQLVPEYGTALDTAAHDIQKVQATRLGQDLLSKSMTRSEARLALRDMSPPELQAVRAGIRGNIDDIMANINAAARDGNPQAVRETFRALNLLDSRQAQEKLAMVLGPDEATNLSTQLSRAYKAAELAAGVADNSRTAPRQMLKAAIDDAAGQGAIGAIRRGEPVNLMKSGGQFLLGGRPQDELARSDELQRQATMLLTGPRGPDALDALLSLTSAYQTGQSNLARSDLVGRALGLGTGVGVYNYGSRK